MLIDNEEIEELRRMYEEDDYGDEEPANEDEENGEGNGEPTNADIRA